MKMATKKKEQPEAAVATEQVQEPEINVRATVRGYLEKTGREGMDDLLDLMEEIGYFTAPASSGGGRHSAEEGGLARHSLNVLMVAEKLSVALKGGKNITDDFRNSLVIVCLLHDLGKCGDYGKKMYVPNILKTTGKQSDKKPWERNKALTNIPHAFRSVIMAERWLDLTEDEEYAIMYHDGLYDRETGGTAVIQGHETELLMILHWADMWASRVIEGSEEKEGE